MDPVKKERSYGAVIFNKEGKILVENMTLGHISIPKGHIEKGETPLMCTLREIKEETGLDIKVDMNFHKDIVYCPYPNISKTVTFFLGLYEGNKTPVPQLIEVTSIEWNEYEEAYKKLTFKTDKEVLEAAYKYYKALKL